MLACVCVCLERWVRLLGSGFCFGFCVRVMMRGFRVRVSVGVEGLRFRV